MGCIVDPSFWSGRRVLLTGHTGFKGSWLALWLQLMRAQVTGYSLEPETVPSLFRLAGLELDYPDSFGDIRDARVLQAIIAKSCPQVVLHMAAQPLVRRSVREPIETFDVNVMGTAHVLDALRNADGLEAILIITTDKVYDNAEYGLPFKESYPLGGHDPYSASKAAAELVTASYTRTYFEARNIPVATARGGNVIGGGDFSEDRIVPDIYRAIRSKTPLMLRNPNATRPWQHVLDCLEGYLGYVQALVKKSTLQRAMNFGPVVPADVPVHVLAEAMQQALGAAQGWALADGPYPREMQTLSLDSTSAQEELGFADHLVGVKAIEETAKWYLAFSRGEDMRAYTLKAIEEHLFR